MFPLYRLCQFELNYEVVSKNQTDYNLKTPDASVGSSNKFDKKSHNSCWDVLSEQVFFITKIYIIIKIRWSIIIRARQGRFVMRFRKFLQHPIATVYIETVFIGFEFYFHFHLVLKKIWAEQSIYLKNIIISDRLKYINIH